MKYSKISLYFAATLFCLMVLGYAINVYCGEGGVQHIIQEAVEPAAGELADHAPEPSGRFVRADVKMDGLVFWTEKRKDKVQRYKCSQCHNNDDVTAQNAAAVAHADIFLDHGGAQRPLSCFTCHKEDERDYFETEKGVTVDMDHVYDLCGQCHFRQKADWIGGAHGKRLDNWTGRRVIANCTSCHDPHSPRFKKRWPATYSLPLD